MPVATLRIWEQRYGAVKPATAASGHRLYSPADMQRVVLLRQLTEMGHAIGSIAALDSAQLLQMARQAQALPHGPTGSVVTASDRVRVNLKLVVVGPALAVRLHRDEVARHLPWPLHRLAVFDSLSEAQAAAGLPGATADVLLWHAPELPLEEPAQLTATQLAWSAARAAVVYRFAGSASLRALAERQVAALREPVDDDALGKWLAASLAPLSSQSATPSPRGAARDKRRVPGPGKSQLPPRRYDDAVLAAIVSRSSSLACECPRHVAELLMQLASFESYSASCTSREAADADLHAYLHQVAGASRALFELALERVAQHEGLSLS